MAKILTPNFRHQGTICFWEKELFRPYGFDHIFLKIFFCSFDAYVLWSLCKKFIFEIVTNFRTHDATVLVVALRSNLLKAGYPINSLSLGILDVIYFNFLSFIRKKIMFVLAFQFHNFSGGRWSPNLLDWKITSPNQFVQREQSIHWSPVLNVNIFLLRYDIISCINFGPNIYNNLFHWNMSYHDNTFIY